jgi:hypothetical protein
MKKKVILLFAFAISVLSIKAQQDSVFYYYFGEKIYLTERTDIMIVKLSNDANKERLFQLIQTDSFVKLRDNTDLEFCSILESKDQSSISAETWNKYKESPDIVYVSFGLEYEDGVMQGLTDEIIVKLKSDTTTLEQFQNLVTENKCAILKENEFVKNQFLISVPKTLDLNSLQIANLFYETGFFEFTQPNFVRFLNLDPPLSINATASEDKTNTLSGEAELFLFPNPVKEVLFMQLENAGTVNIEEVKIYDMYGRLLRTESNIRLRKTEIDIVGLSAGIYFVSCKLSNGEAKTKQIVKE